MRMRILAECYHDCMGKENDWMPLASFLKDALLEMGGGPIRRHGNRDLATGTLHRFRRNLGISKAHFDQA